MRVCPNCALENTAEHHYCAKCGAALSPVPPVRPMQAPYAPPYRPQYQVPPFALPYGAAQNNTGTVVWAIVNMVLSSGMLFGVIALVFAMTAKSAWTQQEYESKMRTAKICNIIGTVCTALVILAGIAYAVFMIIVLLSVPGGMWEDFGEQLYPLVFAR